MNCFIAGSVGFKKMKKILTCGVILVIGIFQLPVLANDPPADQSLSTWATIITALADMDAGNMQYALAPGLTITQANQTVPQGGLVNLSLNPTLNFQGSTISGQLAKATLLEPSPYVLSNGQNGLILKNGTLTSNDTTGAYIAISNNASVSLTNMNIIGGIVQMQTSTAGTTSILAAGNGISNTVTLSGPNSFTAGHINFTGTGSSTLIFDGGNVTDNVTLNVTGAGNTLNVKSGTVLLDGVAGTNQKVDTWNSGAIVGASGTGILTLNSFSNDTTTGAYHQTGGTLNLTNTSILTLQAGGLITTDGSGSGVTTVNIGGSTTNIDGSALVLSAGSNIISANAGDTLALNIGNATDMEAQVTVNGGTIDKSAAITLTNGNVIILNSGSVTFNDSALATKSGDNWSNGYLYTNGGNLTLDNFAHSTQNGIYGQTSGTLTLINGSNLTLTNMGTVTSNDELYTSTVNVGGSGSGSTLTLAGGSITTTEFANTVVNIGNGSNGNTLKVNSGTITQAASGGTTTTINIGDTTTSGNSLVVASASSLDDAVTLVINANNTLNLQAGTTTLSSGDTWKGNVIVNGGNLTMSGIINQSGSSLNQSSNTTLVSQGSTLTLGTGSSVTGGYLTLNGGAANTVSVTGGSIAQAAVVDIETGNTLNISAGSVALDGQNGTADTWNGTVNLSGTGNLTLDNVNNSTPNGAYFQTGGTLNLSDGSDLTMSSGSITTSGSGVNSTVNIGNTGDSNTLTLTSGSITTANAGGSTNVNVGNGSNSNTLTLTSGSITNGTSGTTTVNIGNGSNNNTLNLTSGSITNGTFGNTTVNVGVGASTGNSLNMSSGSIEGSSTVNIGTITANSANNSLTMTGGTIAQSAAIAINSGNTLSLIGAQATLDGDDTWAGAINLSGGGTLSISELQSNGAYSQVNSTLNISTVANLSLSTGSTVTTDGVGTAKVNIGGGPDGSTLNINGGSITTANAGGTTILNIGTEDDYMVNTVNVMSGSITNGTSGTTNVNIGLGSGGAGKLNLSGGSITGSGTTVNIGTTTSGSSNNTLTVSGTGVLDQSATVAVNAGNYLTVSGGTATLDATDTWAGTVAFSGGTLNLDGITSNGIYNQTGGTATMTNSSTVIIGGDGTNNSSITGGTIGFTGTGNTLEIDANGNLGVGAVLNLSSGNNLNVTGGTATLNENGTGIDTWVGAVNLSGGTLTLDSIVSQGSFTQTGGSISVGDTATRVRTEGLTRVHNLRGGDITIGANGHLALLAGDDWTTTNVSNTGGKFTLDGFSHATAANGTYNQTSGALELANGSTLTIVTGSSITGGSLAFTGTGNTLGFGTGSTLGSDLALNISNGNSLTVNGGTATLNGSVTGTDTWGALGTVNVFGGTLNLNTITSNGIFSISGGTMNIASDSILTYIADSSVGGGNIVDNGILNISNAVAKTFATNLTGSGVVNKNGIGITTFSTNGQAFSGTYNQTAGKAIVTSMSGTFFQNATKNLTGGSIDILDTTALTLNSTDTWTGTNISNSGLLTLDHFTHSLTNAVGYNQTSDGSLIITNGSTLNLGAGSSITDGNVAFGLTGVNTLNVATGAAFNPNFAFDILAGNNFNLGGGTATLNDANTDWHGTINVAAGTLELKNFTSHGAYNQSGGTTTVDSGSTLVLSRANSSLTGGTLLNAGTLEFDEATGSTTIATQIGSTSGGGGIINKTGAAELVFTKDSSGFTGTYNQNAGTAVIQNNFFTGANNLANGTAKIATGGNLILNSGDTWGAANIENNGGTLDIGVSHIAGGTFKQTSGTTNLMNNTTLTMDLDATNSALGGGRLALNDLSVLNLSTDDGQTVSTSLSGVSTAKIYKNGGGTLLLTGQNLGYFGDLNINAGKVDFNVASGLTDSYISGKTNLLGTAELDLAYDRSGFLNSPLDLASGTKVNLDTNGNNVTSSSNNISGTGTLNKDGAGEYRVYAGSNGEFDYGLNVNEGTVTLVTDATANFNKAVTVNSSVLRVSSSDTNFKDGLTLDYGYLSILNGGFNVTNGLSVGSTVNTMNGTVAKNNITGDLNIGTSGISEYLIDISPSAGTSDNYAITGNITKDGSLSSGTIQVSDFKIVGPHTLVQSVALKVFDAPTATITDPNIYFTATDKTISTALGQYGLSSQGSGNYLLSWKDFNPQVFRGQVATEAAYANQLTTNNMLFDHIGLISEQLMAEEKPNIYASENPLFAPYQYSKKDGGLWYKAYGNLERLQLTQGINTQNNMWGSMVGADFPVVELKKGWKCLPTAYVGYTGGYQTYSGVNMYQNGGQGGIMGTFYKGDFITSLLANVGGYGNDMNVAGTKDTTGNWFAGVASKTAYNIKLPKHFILQPNMLVSYNAFGGQNWSTDFGNAALTTNMMNGLNLAPGLNLIYNKESWSIYATTQLMCNLMNGTSGSIDDVTLPTVKMASTYFQYGVGVTKRIKDRLSMYVQVVMSNGVRTGVGFQGGFQWKF